MPKNAKDKPENLIHKSFPAYFQSKQDNLGNDLGVVGAFVAVMGNIDYGEDIITNGAFTKTISERASKIKVLDNHNSWSALDAIGKLITIREVGKNELPNELLAEYPDATGGLYVEIQFILEEPSDESAKVFRRIKHGLIDQYSIGFEIVKQEYRDIQTNEGTRQVRVIQEIKLWEVSPVIFAMNPATATVGSKAKDSDLIKDIEDEITNDIEFEIELPEISSHKDIDIDNHNKDLELEIAHKANADNYRMASDDAMCMNCRNFHAVTKNLGYCKAYDTTVTANYTSDGYTPKATMLNEVMSSAMQEFLNVQIAYYAELGIWQEDDLKIINEMLNSLIVAFLDLMPEGLLAREMPKQEYQLPKNQRTNLGTRAESHDALTPVKRLEALQRIAEIRARQNAKRKIK